MTTVGFIGLGAIGLPIACNLHKAGYDVAGFNRSRHRTAILGEAGGRSTASIAEAATGAKVIATMLPDSPTVRVALAGPGGVCGRPAALRCLDCAGKGQLDHSALLMLALQPDRPDPAAMSGTGK
jgi:2-hydroxy-3-oxopropionate reductase